MIKTTRFILLLKTLLVISLFIVVGTSIYNYIYSKPTEVTWLDKDNFIVKTYFDNENIRAVRVLNKDTVFDGRTVMYYQNGQVWLENNYKNGKKEGKEIAYRLNGTIEYIGNYKNGNQDSIWHWYYDNSKENKVRTIENYSNDKPFGGQVSYYISDSLKSYKFYSFEGMLGIINFDSLTQEPNLTGSFNYTIYNRNKLRLGEEYTSMVYVGVPPGWSSKFTATIVDKKGQRIKNKTCDIEKHQVLNTDKYYFSCIFFDSNIYSVECFLKVLNKGNELVYSDTISLDIAIE